MRDYAQSGVKYRAESADDIGEEVTSAATARGVVRAVADRLPTPPEPSRTEVTVRRVDGDERVTYEIWRPTDVDDPCGLLYRGGKPWRPPVDIDADSFDFDDGSDGDHVMVDAVSVALASTDEAIVEKALDAISDAADDLSEETVATLSPWLLQRLAMAAGLGDDDSASGKSLRSSLQAVRKLVKAGHEEVAGDGVLELLTAVARTETLQLAPMDGMTAIKGVEPAVDVIPGTLSMAVADIERAVTEGPVSSALCGSVLDGLEALSIIGWVTPDATASVSEAFVVGAKHDDEYVRQVTLKAIETQSDASDGLTVGTQEALGIFLRDDNLEKFVGAVEMLVKHDPLSEGDADDYRRQLEVLRDEIDDDAVEVSAETALERLSPGVETDLVLHQGTVEGSRAFLDTSAVDDPVFLDASSTVYASEVEAGDDVVFHHVTVEDVAVSINGAEIATVVVPTDPAMDDIHAGNRTQVSEVDGTGACEATATSNDDPERSELSFARRESRPSGRA